MSSTLLLNASYEPLRVISWQRAITLLFLEKVEVVSEYDSRQVRSVSLKLQMPAVVRLLSYVRLSRRKPPLNKGNLLARDEGKCQYCSKELSRSESTIDHIIPRSRGGLTTWENVVIACGPCNRKKGSRTLKQSKMKLAKVVVAPEWLPILRFRKRTEMPSAWLDFML